MSQYARSIHSSFASGIGHSWASSSSSSPYATSSSSAHANFLLGGYLHKYPPGLSQQQTTDWRAPGTGYYPRRRGPQPRRAAPPPPPRTSFIKFDPFADDYGLDAEPPIPVLTPSPRIPVSGSRQTSQSPVLYRSPRMGSSRPAALHTQRETQMHSQPYTIKLEPAPAPPILDRDARSRLVAGILLNRVHAVGKPMRGARCREPREYVKSGLSRVVSVDA
jgi:hypothetical protein